MNYSDMEAATETKESAMDRFIEQVSAIMDSYHQRKAEYEHFLSTKQTQTKTV